MEMGLHLINFHVNWICASCVCWRMNREGLLPLCFKQRKKIQTLNLLKHIYNNILKTTSFYCATINYCKAMT